ncbi:hypothetical protein ACWEQL_27825 [Kitasatospora sp. NPDC004240]
MAGEMDRAGATDDAIVAFQTAFERLVAELGGIARAAKKSNGKASRSTVDNWRGARPLPPPHNLTAFLQAVDAPNRDELMELLLAARAAKARRNRPATEASVPDGAGHEPAGEARAEEAAPDDQACEACEAGDEGARGADDAAASAVPPAGQAPHGTVRARISDSGADESAVDPQGPVEGAITGGRPAGSGDRKAGTARAEEATAPSTPHAVGSLPAASEGDRSADTVESPAPERAPATDTTDTSRDLHSGAGSLPESDVAKRGKSAGGGSGTASPPPERAWYRRPKPVSAMAAVAAAVITCTLVFGLPRLRDGEGGSALSAPPALANAGAPSASTTAAATGAPSPTSTSPAPTDTATAQGAAAGGGGGQQPGGASGGSGGPIPGAPGGGAAAGGGGGQQPGGASGGSGGPIPGAPGGGAAAGGGGGQQPGGGSTPTSAPAKTTSGPTTVQYNEVHGYGCDAEWISPDPQWQQTAGGPLDLGCHGQALWRQVTGQADYASDGITWRFKISRPGASCTLWVHIPDTTYAAGTATYAIDDNNDEYPHLSGNLRIDQASRRGQWASLGEWTVPADGWFSVIIGNKALNNGDSYTVAASAARAQCRW